jgi:two-component system response regulator PilR (NtrC family)
MRKIENSLYDVVVTDIRMPDVTGMDVLQFARRVSPDTLVIIITAVDDAETSIQALNAGAFHYVRKSGASLPGDVRAAVQLAIERQSMRMQNAALVRDASARNSLDNIIGESAVMGKLKDTIRTVSSTASTILILGESGTGKELVARAVHACSPRDGNSFVSINCGAFPETLLESELFGYVKGAFTGANANKRGLFEMANTGSIFLDEISEMSLTMQVKLLRVLQERTVRPVGGVQETPIDVRVIAASNKDLDHMVAEGTFREDLFYRLSVIPLHVPPLRERGDDVVLLANHFLKKYAGQMGKRIREIAPDSMQMLKGYDWPGNVRVLENTIERAVALEQTEVLRVDLPGDRPKSRAAAAAAGVSGPPGVALPPEGLDLERYIADIERSLLQSALRRSNGVQTKAAEILKLSYRSFRHLMKKYEL